MNATKQTTFESVEELGRKLIDNAIPEDRQILENYGAEAVGRHFLAKSPDKYAIAPTLKSWDPDWSKALDSYAPDAVRTFDETVEGLVDPFFQGGEFTPWEGAKDVVTGLKNIAQGGVGTLLEEAIPDPEEPSVDPPSFLESLAGLQGLFGSNVISTPEQREMFKTISDEWLKSFQPKKFEQRPALATSNALIPLPGGILKTLGSIGKGSALKRAVPIATEMLGRAATLDPFEYAGQLGRGFGYVTKEGGSFKGSAQERLRPEGGTIAGEVFEGGLGFTTGQGANYIRNLIRRSGAGNFDEVFRKFRRAEPADSTTEFGKNVFEAMNDYQKKISAEYERAMDQIFQHDLSIDTTLLKESLDEIVKDVGATIEINPKGRAVVKFDEFSPVSEMGGSRSAIKDPLEEFLNLSDSVGAKNLHGLRRKLDDTLSTVSPDQQVSGHTRRALENTRSQVAGILEKELEALNYKEHMSKYEGMAHLRSQLKGMGLNTGKLTGGGYVDEEALKHVLEGTEKAYGGTMSAARGIRALDKLEKITGRDDIVASFMGMMAHNLMGSGLVVQSEISKIGRLGLAAAAGAEGLSGTWLTLPALTLFSPKISSEVLLTLVPPARKTKKFVQSHVKRMEKISSALHSIDRILGGELRKEFSNEARSIAVLLERLEEQTGVELKDAVGTNAKTEQ